MRYLVPIVALLVLLLASTALGSVQATPPTRGGSPAISLPLVYSAPPTPTPTVTPIPPGPPTISEPSYQVVQVNDPDCSNDGTRFHITVGYLDGDGNVTQAGSTLTLRLLNVPNQPSLDYRGTSIVVVGDGTSGTVTAIACIKFITYDSFDVGLELVDAAGMRSTRVTMVLPRPDGASLPEPGAPPALLGR